MMGMILDGNGKYIGWSNLFDYSSLKSLEESEYLPLPKGKQYTIEQTGTDISEYVDQLKSGSILTYAKLLNYLNKINSSSIYDSQNRDITDILDKLNLHENTKLPIELIEGAYKNFISSHIQNAIQNLRNMVSAYTPITMEDMQEGSSNTPKGERSKRITSLNPLSKYVMQKQNITGKEVIGISATGMKATYTWTYYLNDILQKDNKELIENARFSFTTTRIWGRRRDENGILGVPSKKTINSLPQINWDILSEETKQFLLNGGNLDDNVLIGKIAVDLIQSQVLSASTDNAKELILDKINCNSNLAKYYLFLITLGYDVRDIIGFMTTDTISFIELVTKPNIYNQQGITINQTIDLLNGIIPPALLRKFAKNNIQVNKFNNILNELNLANNFKNNTLDNILNSSKLDELSFNDFYLFQDYIIYLQQLRNKMPDISNPEVKEDVKEFQMLTDAANEYSSFAGLLSINQGIKTKEVEFKKFLDRIAKVISSRELQIAGTKTLTNAGRQKIAKEYGVSIDLVGTFDINQWMKDANYRDTYRQYYNKIKLLIPIFDIIENVPQFKSAFDLLRASYEINHNASLKTKIWYEIIKSVDSSDWSDKYETSLLNTIPYKIIEQFLYSQNISLPYRAGMTILNKNMDEEKVVSNGFIKLDNIIGLANFKYVFENYIIPELKLGILTDVTNNGNIQKRYIDKLKNNKFIQGLVSGFDNDVPIYRLDIDMMNYKDTTYGLINKEQYEVGLKELKNIYMNGKSLADWFMLYNLYVNHNNYGSNRLTTIFESQVNKDSILSKYYNYLGNLDYFGTIEKISNSVIRLQYNDISIIFNIDDLEMIAAPSVTIESNRKEPIIRLVTNNGSEYKKRNGFNFNKISLDLYNPENISSIIKRQDNINKYMTLGGLITSESKTILENLDSVTTAAQSLIKLQRSNQIQFFINCK